MKKTFLLFLGIGATIILLLIGAGFLFLQKEELTPPVQSPTPFPSPMNQGAPLPVPTPTTQPYPDTATWETYRNKKYGFEIMYPSGWKVNLKDPQLPDSVFTLTSPATIKQREEGKYWAFGFVDIGVRVLNFASFSELDEKLEPKDFFITNKQKTIINGYPAYLMTVGGQGESLYIYFEKHNKLYNIIFYLEGSFKELTPIKSRILSTFRLTE